MNARGYSGSALSAGTYWDCREVAKVRLAHDTDVNVQGGDYSHTLQAVAASGNDHLVKLLIDNGAEVDAKGGCFGYALQAASYWARVEVVKVLLDNDAAVDAQGELYGSALDEALNPAFTNPVTVTDG